MAGGIGATDYERFFFLSYGFGSLLIDAGETVDFAKGLGDVYPRGKKIFLLEFRRNGIVSVLLRCLDAASCQGS